jgi:hypothetical protein
MLWSEAMRFLDSEVTWGRISLIRLMVNSTQGIARGGAPLLMREDRVSAGKMQFAIRDRNVWENERTVAAMTEIARKILWPSKESPNWRCSDCAWSQPFVTRLEMTPDVPSKAIGDAFNRHKCTEHRHPKWVRAIP